MTGIDYESSLKQYKNSLANVCFFSALLQKYADRKGKVDKEEIVYAATMLKKYKQFLLIDKDFLGFTDGLSFMEDNRFFGFEIVNGKFSGNRDKIKGIVKKWIDGFPDTANNYQYEVAILALALAFPDEIEETLEPLKKAA